jgi:hypothetical protein
MVWIPKLPRTAISDASKRASARGTPVRGQYRLPNDKNIHLTAVLARQQIFGCGGPPQASRSSRGQQKNKPWNIRFRVECLREFWKVRFGERDNWRLTRRRSAGSP